VTADEFWRSLFGRSAPVEIEIGSGTGAFLWAAAVLHPERNLFGIEYSASRHARLAQDIERRGLPNVRVLRADAACVIANVIPDASVGAYHIAFPDPWWKRRHHRRRLFTPEFVAALARTLRPGGTVHVITDVAEYFTHIVELLDTHFLRQPAAAKRPAVTRFESKALARGATIHAAAFRKPTGSPGLTP